MVVPLLWAILSVCRAVTENDEYAGNSIRAAVVDFKVSQKTTTILVRIEPPRSPSLT